MKSPLKASIKNDYMGFNGTNIVSLGWNFAHRQVKIKRGLMFSCCGVDSYNDFTGGVKWNTNYGGGLKAPITCCVTIPDSATPTCAVTPSDIYTKVSLRLFCEFEWKVDQRIQESLGGFY
uniref:Uncharacterized protein n=1 Tax=Magallana gigas TaxID=29159 RepID=K1Q8H2_MAGGI